MRWMLGLAAMGCVASTQEVRAPVDQVVRARLGGPAIDAAAVDGLLAKPLDAGAAVRIALANSPRLRVAYDELDVAAGDLAAALGLGPVSIDAQLRFGDQHDEVEIDAVQSLIGLFEMPGRRGAAHAEMAAARAGAAAAALRLAARVEIAFHDVLAAQQDVELRKTAFDAADAAATLRERMRAAGNTTELAQARDRDAREQARIELGRAEAAVVVRREALNGLLGLSGGRTKWTAAGELGALPAEAPALGELEVRALSASLDLEAGRARRDAAEHKRSTERLRTVLPEFGAGVSVVDDGEQTSIGPALRIGIPLFDFRSGERARANAEVRRAGHVLEAESGELAAAARAARVVATATYAEARHLHEVVLPLRQQIVDETLKHYNAMDANPFELIVARRELVEGAHQYVDALRRYWNAMAEVHALERGVRIVTEEPQ